MRPSNDNTQPVRTIQSGPGCIRRIVQLLFLTIVAVGIFALGYATGSGVEILAPANALIETVSASLPDSLQTLSARSLLPTSTPLPTLESSEASRLLTPANSGIAPSPTPMPTATEPPPTQAPLPTATRPPPTPTTTAPSCYRHPQAWVTGEMNVRVQSSINAQKVDPARAAGIAPVHRGHPAYPRMDDRNNDGAVCE